MTKTKKPREKGIPVPSASINEAIGYIRKVYEHVGDRAMSFDEAMGIMGISPAYGKVFVKVFKDYGLMEQIKGGFWRITDLGVKCIHGDHIAVKQAFEKVGVFKQLMEVFGKGRFTQKAVNDYLKNKYHKPESYVKNAAEKFWSGKEYLEHIERGVSTASELEFTMDKAELRKTMKIIQLGYAFKPPSESDVEKLIEEVYEEFKDSENSAIKTLVESLKENKAEKNSRLLLFKNLRKILSEKYPTLKEFTIGHKNKKIDNVNIPNEEN